ncbi:hypothetical protein B0H14DRAFT_2563585 [Mycena olivaceomarginata]|nr:hypothetical protein B0H14DRAFT_2563585 [Mycena olivaceomarginata]
MRKKKSTASFRLKLGSNLVQVRFKRQAVVASWPKIIGITAESNFFRCISLFFKLPPMHMNIALQLTSELSNGTRKKIVRYNLSGPPKNTKLRCPKQVAQKSRTVWSTVEACRRLRRMGREGVGGYKEVMLISGLDWIPDGGLRGMVIQGAAVLAESGCGVQVVIPRANDFLDLSGKDVRASELDDATADWRPTKLLDKRTSSEFVLAVNTVIFPKLPVYHEQSFFTEVGTLFTSIKRMIWPGYKNRNTRWSRNMISEKFWIQLRLEGDTQSDGVRLKIRGRWVLLSIHERNHNMVKIFSFYEVFLGLYVAVSTVCQQEKNSEGIAVLSTPTSAVTRRILGSEGLKDVVRHVLIHDAKLITAFGPRQQDTNCVGEVLK